MPELPSRWGNQGTWDILKRWLLTQVLRLAVGGEAKIDFGASPEIAAGGVVEVAHNLGVKPRGIAFAPLNLLGAGNLPSMSAQPTAKVITIKNTGATAIICYWIVIG